MYNFMYNINLFHDYSTFNDVNKGYSDLIKKVNSIVDEIAPVKEMCVKNNTEEWVNEETFEAIRVRDKKYQRFKRTRLYADHLSYKKSRNQVKKLINRQKRNFIKGKLTENIGNSKELWKTLKKLGLPTKMKDTLKYVLEKKGMYLLIQNQMLKYLTFFMLISQWKLPLPTSIFGTHSVK